MNPQDKIFVPLHVHSMYSRLIGGDGFCFPRELAQRAKDIGCPAIALTDHGTMAGTAEFYRDCQKIGIKPILGIEAYITPMGHSLDERIVYDVKDMRGKPGYVRSNYHLIMLAKDETGWRNLTELSKQSFAKGYYYKPRIDHELLKEHHEGLVVSAACILGEVANLAWCDDYTRMRETAQWYQDVFGEDYYLEVMYHGLDMERKALAPIRDLGKELGIKVIATNDSHYSVKSEYKLHKALMLDKMHKSFSDADVSGSFFGDDDDVPQKGIEEEGGDSNPIFETSSELYIKDWDEMVSALAIEGASVEDVETELATTLEIADKCNYELPIIDPTDMSAYYTPVYPVEKDLQYDAFKESGFEIKQSTVDAIIDEMHKDGREGDKLEDFLNDHEMLSLRFLMWMCDKGLRENVLPKLKARGEALPMEFWCENPPEGFSIRHTHNSPDELWIREQMKNGLSVDDMIQVYQERIDYEVAVVVRKGFIDYFSVVQNYANFTKLNGSVMGPGRGSGGGSLLLYLLSITSIDPIPNKLLFFRFLNPDRKGYPDVDLDWSADFRDNRLKPYLREFYGDDYCAQVATYMYYWGKAAIKSAARILFPMPDSVQIGTTLSDALDDKPKLDLNKELDGSNPQFEQLVNSRQEYKQTIELARMIQGRLSGESIHASAYIVSPKKLTDIVPLGVNKEERARAQKDNTEIKNYIIQFEGSVVQDVLGLVKLDLLCVVDLEMMEMTCKAIERVYGCKINLERIPLDDAAVWTMLQEHLVAGIFQLDGSEGMAKVMDQVRPENIENINAIVALYRPGPMDYIPNYVEGKKHPEKVKYLDERLRPILQDTYGVCTYQEQSMQITQVIGGFSGGQADHFRKCLHKDTLMWTPDGPYTIEELAQQKKLGNKMKVHTLDDKECLPRFNRVRAAFSNGVKPLVKVTLDDGSSIKCTPDHQFLTECGWVEAQDLVGHYVYKDITIKYGNLSEPQSKLLVLTAMITKGSMPQKHGSWTFCNKDQQEITAFVHAYKQCFGKAPKVNAPDTHGVTRVLVERANIQSLGLTACKSDKKSLPSWVFRLNKPSRDFLVGKMIDFDGYFTQRMMGNSIQYLIGYASKNRSLCEQMLILFNCMGVRANIYSKYNKEYDRDYYAVEIRNTQDIWKVAQAIAPYSTKAKNMMPRLEDSNIDFDEEGMTTSTYTIPNEYWYPRIMSLINNSGYSARELFGQNPPRQDNSKGASLPVLRRFLATAGRNKQLERLSAENKPVCFASVKSVEDAGFGEVYDFTMNTGCLPQAFANGILVHNCSAKKHMDQLVLLKDDFINGAIENNTSPEIAEELWTQLVKFGSYSFNRSHSAAYALIAYRGAFLKAHFPECFFASLCTLKPKAKKTNKVPEYLDEARQMGVVVKPPHVNYSEAGFDVPERGVIAFGLGGISGVGSAANYIVEERHAHGPFKDFSDFMTRVPREVGKGALLPLMKHGALDGLGWSRKAMVESIDQIIDFRKRYFASQEQRRSLALDLFSLGAPERDERQEAESILLTPPFDTEYNKRQMLEMEKRNFGTYLSGSPEDYRRLSRYATEQKMGREYKAAMESARQEAERTGRSDVPPRPVHVRDLAEYDDYARDNGKPVTFICVVSDPVAKNKPNPRVFQSGKGCSVNIQDWGVLEESRVGFSPRIYKSRLTIFKRQMDQMALPQPGDLLHVTGKVNIDKTGEWPNSVIVDEIEVIPDDRVLMSTMSQKDLLALRERLDRVSASMGDPSSDMYVVPTFEFPSADQKDAFVASATGTERFKGTGHVLVTVAGDGSAPETLDLRPTVQVVQHAQRFGATVKKFRLPKAQSAIERMRLMKDKE